MKTDLVNEIMNRLNYLSPLRGNLVIDGDVHLSDIDAIANEDLKLKAKSNDYYQGKPISIGDALANMEMAGVDMCLVWQNPSVTSYNDSKDFNFSSLLKANEYIYKAVSNYPNRFIPGGWVDPKATDMELTRQLIKICVEEFGFPIIKINPAQNQFMIDSDVVFKVVEEIYAYGAIPAFHFGADTPYTPVEGLEKVVDYARERPVIAIHMGGGGASYIEADETYTKARALGLRYPNLKYVLSAKRDTHIESDLISYQAKGAPFSHNLMCASDAPYGNMSWNFGGYRALFKSLKYSDLHCDERVRQGSAVFDDQSVANYMGGNMARLAMEGYHSILRMNGKS